MSLLFHLYSNACSILYRKQNRIFFISKRSICEDSSPFCAPRMCVGFCLKCLLLSSDYNQNENTCMFLTLVISLLPSYVTVDYRANADRRLDKAKLIDEVLLIFVEKIQNINFVELWCSYFR
jgi:hypothetical protein